MAWLIIAIFFVVWLAEVVFGWLEGRNLRDLLMIAALIYFGMAMNTLKVSQAELQRELQRVWKIVKSLQTSLAAFQRTEDAREQAAEADIRHRQTTATEAGATLTNASSLPGAGQTLSAEGAESLAVQAVSVSVAQSEETVLTEEILIPALSETLPPPKYEWFEQERARSDTHSSGFEEWLAGGNWIVRSGLAILFIGLAFLAKFAYDNALLPLELRLAAIAGFALALLTIGWRSRTARPAYGLSLQGGGVATLYLTIFATAKLTAMLPPLVAMLMMLLVAVLAAGLAILQDAMALAVIGTVGGFMAPLLMSTGQGSHIALFSYFAALDAGILTVALSKAWRPLNLLAFFFTYGIAGLWGLRSYQQQHELSCLLFLALFFALFIAVSILFTRHKAGADELNRTIDATLLFGVPTVTFGFDLYLLKPYEYGGAWLSVVLSFIYLLLAYFAKGREALELLKAPWAALSLLFATLAVPLAFDARLTSSIWALEGAAVVSYGWRQMQAKTRGFGYLLVVLVTAGFVTHWPDITGSVPVFNAVTIGLLVLTLAYGIIGWSVNRVDESIDPVLVRGCSDEAVSVSWLMAMAAALTGGLVIVIELYSRNPAALASIAAPALLWLWALALQRFGQSSNWPQTTAPAIVLPLLTLLLPLHHVWLHDGLTMPGFLLTAAALTALLAWQAVALKQLLPDLKALFADNAFPVTLSAIPGFTLWAFWLILFLRGRTILSYSLLPGGELTMHGWFIPLASVQPVMLLWWLARPEMARQSNVSPVLWRWLHGDDDLPYAAVYRQLRFFALLTLAYILATTLFHSGTGSYGLSYLPVLNFYELIALGGLLALFKLFRHTGIGETVLGENRGKFLSVIAFLFVNSILSRILVNFFGAEFALGFAWRSAIAATTYSIVWTFAALIMMWLASGRMQRGLWITGAVLLGVVAVKLLMIDLSKVGSLARIISFIGVGVLMLIVGYIAPIPANAKASAR